MSSREKSIYRVTIIGSIGNFVLLVFKFLAGIFGRSGAMIADAVHSLSDFVTDIIVLVFVKFSNKPQDEDHDFGHGKYETLATAIIGMVLVGVAVKIFIGSADSIWKWAHGEELGQPGILALAAALASILIKEVLYRYTVRVGRKVDSQVVVANAWHHRSDALSSIGTAVGIGGAILLGARWRVLDPLAALIVSFFIVRVAFQLIKPSIDELVEKSLPKEVEQDINRALLEVCPDCDPHNLRTRRIGNRNAVEVHVRMDGGLTVKASHDITHLMETRIKTLLGGDTFINIHVEPKKETSGN